MCYVKKRTAFCLIKRTSMEDRALETLRKILGRRGLPVETTSISEPKPERTNLYKVGDVIVIMSQKDRGLQDKDLRTMVTFAKENGMEKSGLIVVSMAPPSENVVKAIRSIIQEFEGRFEFFHINELQFDITTHRMVSPHRILKEDEKTDFLRDRKIRKPEEELPGIDVMDIMARWIGARPGDIVRIDRHSDVGGSVEYYRYCLA
jgi:DNA-directed RNA polymerase subunit H